MDGETSMKYSVWDVELGKDLGQFTDEAEALALVRRLIDRRGIDFAERLALGRVGDDGAVLDPIMGRALVAQAKGAVGPVAEDEMPSHVIGSRVYGGSAGISGLAAKMEPSANRSTVRDARQTRGNSVPPSFRHDKGRGLRKKG